MYLLEACITSSIFARPFPCPEFLALLKQLSNDVEAASPRGFNPSAKASFQSVAMYEVSTTLQMGNGAMLANIPREVSVLGRSDSTQASAAWRRAVPCPALCQPKSRSRVLFMPRRTPVAVGEVRRVKYIFIIARFSSGFLFTFCTIVRDSKQSFGPC